MVSVRYQLPTTHITSSIAKIIKIKMELLGQEEMELFRIQTEVEMEIGFTFL